MIIYKTICKINGKFYIGQDFNNNPNYLGSGKILKKAIDKYGKENFEKITLQKCANKEELNEREIYWIKELNATNNKIGYNLAFGGEGGDTFTNKSKKLKNITIKKLSRIGKQNIKRGLGIASKSKKGIHITEIIPEIKEKWFVNYSKGMELCKERRKKGILTNKEKKGYLKLKKTLNTKKVRKKRSELQKGTKNSNWLGYLYIFDKNNELIYKFDSMKHASDVLNLDIWVIRKLCFNYICNINSFKKKEKIFNFDKCKFIINKNHIV
jgi:hypothetical protein